MHKIVLSSVVGVWEGVSSSGPLSSIELKIRAWQNKQDDCIWNKPLERYIIRVDSRPCQPGSLIMGSMGRRGCLLSCFLFWLVVQVYSLFGIIIIILHDPFHHA